MHKITVSAIVEQIKTNVERIKNTNDYHYQIKESCATQTLEMFNELQKARMVNYAQFTSCGEFYGNIAFVVEFLENCVDTNCVRYFDDAKFYIEFKKYRDNNPPKVVATEKGKNSIYECVFGERTTDKVVEAFRLALIEKSLEVCEPTHGDYIKNCQSSIEWFLLMSKPENLRHITNSKTVKQSWKKIQNQNIINNSHLPYLTPKKVRGGDKTGEENDNYKRIWAEQKISRVIVGW